MRSRSLPLLPLSQRLRFLFGSVLLLGFGASLSVPAVAQSNALTQCSTVVPANEQNGFVPLPQGDVFCGLIADPKRPHSFASYHRGTSPTLDTDVAAVGVGENFGLFRWRGLQLGLEAGIFSQFDLRTPSYDLVNADYIIGLPVTFRYLGFSARMRVYHQSSHLGDEYLLRGPEVREERENLSFESLELILSQEISLLRLYGGGEYLFNRNPEDLEKTLVHGGVEIRPEAQLFRFGSLGSTRFIAGLDVKSSEEQDWKVGWSARGGLEVGRADISTTARRWSLMIEYYDGPSPYGQFYQENITYYGLGLHLSL
jgi:hypothetical protein